MTDLVRNARPPRLVVGLMNPLLKLVLRSPAGRAIGPLALLSFAGRRSGRRISVVVGWHHVSGSAVVVTPASWRVNFEGGAAATVFSHGRRAEFVGTLTTDPSNVSKSIVSLLGDGTSPRALALSIADGHTITADDVRRVDRAVIEFVPVQKPAMLEKADQREELADASPAPRPSGARRT